MFNTQAEVAASAEAQFKQQQQTMQAFVDTVANHAPAGSEAALQQTVVASGTAGRDAERLSRVCRRRCATFALAANGSYLNARCTFS